MSFVLLNNIILLNNASCYLYFQLYRNMGFSQEDMDRFFGGPAFLAWYVVVYMVCSGVHGM